MKGPRRRDPTNPISTKRRPRTRRGRGRRGRRRRKRTTHRRISLGNDLTDEKAQSILRERTRRRTRRNKEGARTKGKRGSTGQIKGAEHGPDTREAHPEESLQCRKESVLEKNEGEGKPKTPSSPETQASKTKTNRPRKRTPERTEPAVPPRNETAKRGPSG